MAFRVNRNNFVKVLKADDTRQSLRTNTLGKKLQALEQTKRPLCLSCHKAIDLRQNRVGDVRRERHAVPHGWTHDDCERGITSEALAFRVEQYHNNITTQGLAVEAA